MHHETALLDVKPARYLVYKPLQYTKKYSKAHSGRYTPHIFAVAAVTYQDMVRDNKDQCCVISGKKNIK